ncbi:Hypothetical protein CINCED_3A025745 [Cinara cedri]|uniref:Fibronectin type III,Immunoglobulin subtype,Immunoglobulin-like domain,Immunoglobulin-like n=2 Tax=Cinara cedri TaxID=506608 RepID=A0A5E4N962_9HEMI|nr:Hypothetical protein CINCED_3A025745 [Cinara cedri]
MTTVTTSAVILPLLVLLLSHVSTAGATVRADTADEIGPDSTWIVEPPETGVAVRGKPYTIKCHSNLPNVTYRWMFNNRTLDLVKDSRRRILPDGSLYFNKVVNKKSSDAGSYRCIVQTPYGAVSSKTFTLLLAALHDFDESPVGVTVNSEASRSIIRFTCHVNSIPEATIMWQKNEIPLSTNNRFITKVPGVLYIKQVNENDTGSYRCVAKNNLMNKTKFSEVGHLKVEKINNDLSSGSQSNIQPLALISPNTLYPIVKYVAEGENVTFECAATGVPSPQLKWSFTASIGNKQNTMLSNKDTYVNILSLTRVTTNSSGTYTCHVFQPMTRRPDYLHAQVFQLEVMTPPTITIRPETRSVPLANSIRLKCGVQGNPIPNITWYLNGECLKFYGRVKINKDKQLLLVSNTVSTDSGIYQCFASNQYGTTWAGALITISSSSYKPAPPINISCRTLSPTQIQVFWQKSPKDIPDNPPIHFRQDSIQLVPAHSENPLSSSSATVATDIKNKLQNVYTIHYMITDGGEETLIVSLNHSIIVEKLKPYKNYTFYVRVYNRKSGSDQSEKVTCKTQDEAPQTVPDLNVIPLSPISLHVEWSAINANLALFGSITHYHIMWRRFGSASNYIQVLHKNTRQYTITGLKPGGQYEVQVLGATQNGFPNIDFSWNFVELPAIDPILPLPVLNYTISKSLQLIKLSWSVDDWSVKFNFYKLMYRITSQTNQSLMSLQNFEPNITTHAIHYTSDMDVYEILLNCVNENKEGESITRIIAIHLNMFSPPSQIEAVATSLHTVNVSWVPPDSEDLSSLLFIITYNLISNSENDTSTTLFTELGVSSYELSRLKPYSLYEIKISVQDKTNRKSEFSQKIQVRTLQGVPGIVEQIEWHWMNTNTVHISWVEPIKSNGEIMGYYLSYTSELNLPPTTWQQLNVSRQKKSLNLSGLNNDTRYFFMLRAATDAGFGPQSGIFSIEPMTTYAHSSVNSKQPVEPALYMEDEQLLGIVIGCVIGVICILICTTSIMIKRQCMKNERMRNTQQNTLGSDVAYCAQNLQTFTVDHVHEESVPLNDFSYITRHMVGGRGRYSNNISGMAALPLLDHSNVGDHDLTNVHIIENPQCTVDVDVDAYDVDSLLSESAEGGAGTEESGCSDQLAKSQKGGDSSVADDGFHEHLEPNKILVG